jgi:hypothetical protein
MQLGQPRKKVDCKAQEIVHAEAAGIDVAAASIGLSPDRVPEPVRRFRMFYGRFA